MVYQPKHLAYWRRYKAWLEGVCPYCGGKTVIAEPYAHKLKHLTVHGVRFNCLSCNAQNKFTNPKVSENP